MSAMEQASARRIEVKMSTERKPYHYVGAGLPNVYLSGVEYRVEKETGMQSADIPCLPALLDALAEALLYKASPLSGDELRFLRKRLGKPSKEFATYVGLSSEQYSRIENGATVTPTVDKLVRILYAGFRMLSSAKVVQVAQTTWSAEITLEQKIIATQDESRHWIVKTKAA
jgi:transcriptional regulator with XRE-family HTH domain